MSELFVSYKDLLEFSFQYAAERNVANIYYGLIELLEKNNIKVKSPTNDKSGQAK